METGLETELNDELIALRTESIKQSITIEQKELELIISANINDVYILHADTNLKLDYTTFEKDPCMDPIYDTVNNLLYEKGWVDEHRNDIIGFNHKYSITQNTKGEFIYVYKAELQSLPHMSRHEGDDIYLTEVKNLDTASHYLQ